MKSKVILVLWIDDVVSYQYVARLNHVLNPYKNPFITTAMENDSVLDEYNPGKFYRPMVVFDYDPNEKAQKCFSYSSPKHNDNLSDLIYYFLPDKNHNKIVLTNPIFVPSKYIKIMDFSNEINNSNNRQTIQWLESLRIRYDLTRKNREEILYQYQCIKYCSDSQAKFNYRGVQRAHNKMINEDKVEKFCKQELKSIDL